MLEYLYSAISNNVDAEDSSKQVVYVNVYDMIQPNYITQFGYYALGVGIFHSGVEIGGKEYCFGGHEIPNVTGVFVVEPKIGIPELSLKRTFNMGVTDLTEKQVEELLIELSDEFTGPSYNLLTRNCNHFTEEFVLRLNNKTLPTWINRAAKLGNMFPCVVPWDWIQPPELAEEAEEEVHERETQMRSEPGVKEEGEEDEEEGDIVCSRRSSTISLLSSRRTRSNYTYSTHEGRSSSQERLVGHTTYHVPISKFQSVIFPEERNE